MLQQESMKVAASEIKSTITVNNIPCARVSRDGLWQKRGQNSSEAINGVIWSRVPKSTFVSKGTIEMGAHSAIIHYNDV